LCFFSPKLSINEVDNQLIESGKEEEKYLKEKIERAKSKIFDVCNF
jgi:hypothetical protein